MNTNANTNINMNITISTEIIDKFFDEIEPEFIKIKEMKVVKLNELDPKELNKFHIITGQRLIFMKLIMEIFTIEHKKSRDIKDYDLCEYLFQILRKMGVDFDVQ